MSLGDTLSVCAAAAALPAAPTSWAYVGDTWPGARKPGDAVLEIWSDAAATFTALELDGAVPKALLDAAVAAKTFTVADQPTGQLTASSHAYQHGDGPVRLTTSGALPTGLATGTDYYIGVVDSNTVQIYPTFEAAMKKTGPVVLSSAGSGTNQIAVTTTSVNRLRWMRVALLGSAGAGAVAAPYSYRFTHVPHVVAYALVGTVASGTATASVYLENPVL